MNKTFTYSSREFTRNVAAAKRAAHEGTVFITDRGHPAYVLLSISAYSQLLDKEPLSLLEMMSQIPSGTNIDFNPEKTQISSKTVNFD